MLEPGCRGPRARPPEAGQFLRQGPDSATPAGGAPTLGTIPIELANPLRESHRSDTVREEGITATCPVEIPAHGDFVRDTPIGTDPTLAPGIPASGLFVRGGCAGRVAGENPKSSAVARLRLPV